MTKKTIVWLTFVPAVHFHAGSAPENIVIDAGINEFESSFCAIISHCFSRD